MNIVAGALGGTGPGAGWRIGPDEAAGNHLVAGTLSANGKAAGSATTQDAECGLLVAQGPAVSPALKARDWRGPSSDGDGDGAPLIAHVPEVHATLVGRSSRGGGQTNSPGHNADESLIVAGTLNAGMGRRSAEDPERGLYVAHTLRGDSFDASEDGAGRGTPLIAHAFDARQTDVLQYGAISGPMDTRIPGPSALVGAAVRRLTPRECERLQGMPDDYTRIPNWDGWRAMGVDETPEQCAEDGLEVRQNKKTGRWRVKDVDGPRYKAIGNSWAVNCARWIGRRIELVETIDARRAAA